MAEDSADIRQCRDYLAQSGFLRFVVDVWENDDIARQLSTKLNLPYRLLGVQLAYPAWLWHGFGCYGATGLQVYD